MDLPTDAGSRTDPAFILLAKPRKRPPAEVFAAAHVDSEPVAWDTLSQAARDRVTAISTSKTTTCDGYPGCECLLPVGRSVFTAGNATVRRNTYFYVLPDGTVRCEDCQHHVAPPTETA